ncbi:hypothetical protein ACQY0O_007487 [Thecaphora frezii]
MSIASIPQQGRLTPLASAEQLHVAVAQLLPCTSALQPPAALDGSEALAKLRSCARDASCQGADVIVFPEYFLSGVTHGLWNRARHQSGSAAPEKEAQEEKEWLATVKQVAREQNIDIVAGTVVELHPARGVPHPSKRASKGELYNTAYYVSRRGEVVHRYTKQNLWHSERATLSASTRATHSEQHDKATFCIMTKRGLRLRAGLAICWDLAWVERFHQMLPRLQVPPDEQQQQLGEGDVSDLDEAKEAKGPDVVFIPTCWYASDGGAAAFRYSLDSEARLIASLCSARALELEAAVVLCNVAGPSVPREQLDELQARLRQRTGGKDDDVELPLVGMGNSLIAVPFVDVEKVAHERETMMLSSVDVGLLREARKVYGMRRDWLAKAAGR